MFGAVSNLPSQCFTLFVSSFLSVFACLPVPHARHEALFYRRSGLCTGWAGGDEHKTLNFIKRWVTGKD